MVISNSHLRWEVLQSQCRSQCRPDCRQIRSQNIWLDSQIFQFVGSNSGWCSPFGRVLCSSLLAMKSIILIGVLKYRTWSKIRESFFLYHCILIKNGRRCSFVVCNNVIWYDVVCLTTIQEYRLEAWKNGDPPTGRPSYHECCSRWWAGRRIWEKHGQIHVQYSDAVGWRRIRRRGCSGTVNYNGYMLTYPGKGMWLTFNLVYTLNSLKIEQCIVNIILEQDEEVIFENVGKKFAYLPSVAC